jgi:predicted nucleic-acid-binding protein
VIALDTNILVRFLVEDDPEQTRVAQDLIQRIVEADARGFLGHVVLVEVVWVLEARYRVSRRVIVDHLKKLLRSRHLEFQSKEWVQRAVRRYSAEGGDFADYLIQEAAEQAGCAVLATFDRALHKQSSVLPPEAISEAVLLS